PAINESIRQQMGAASVKAAKAVNYIGAGTIEYIFNRQNNEFYFMEMNTRIQVEHPVTEMVTGVDLIKEQIRVANNEPLSFKQEDITFDGAAIECRINAENPFKGFLPSPGKITTYMPAGGLGVRVDSAVYPEYHIPPYYVSLFAKLLSFGRNRVKVIQTMKRVIEEFVLDCRH